MRIAVWHNLPSGGGKRALYDQVRGLLARGHQIEAWCPPSADRTYLPLSTLVPEHVIPLELSFQPASGFFARCRPLNWNVPLKVRAMDRHCRRCAEQINAGGFDLLFAAASMYFHPTSIGQFARIPKVLYLGEPCRGLYESMPELPWLAQSWTWKDLFDPRFWKRTLARNVRLSGMRVLGREERKNAMAFDEILVNSLFSRESVLRAYGADSKVCYLGVDTENFVRRQMRREPMAVTISSLVPAKNAEFLIRALSLVPAQVRPPLIWVANIVDQPYRATIEQLAQNTGVQFELRQRIADSELVELLNRARVMIYASRLEPFGYAPLEANACGVPVIAVAEGGVRETIEDGVNGILVEHDPAAMAGGIERLMTDEELTQRLGENAYQIARTKWSLPTSIDRLECRLKAVLAKAR